jgi:hypothetical protein
MISRYLEAEQDLGRVAPGADVTAVAGMLIGTGHLMFADRSATSPSPSSAEVDRMMAAALAGVVR